MAKKKVRKPALKVVFDTNALWTEPAHHLLSKDIKELIASNSTHQDVEVTWHLPEVVLHERTYQMQDKAMALLGPIDRVEKLLGHKLAITGSTLKDQVKKVVEEQRGQHSILPIILDTKRVDWTEVCRRAAFREPPFEQQKEGKGFRDAVIIESLMQLIEDSPATEAICRIAFVSSDAVIRQAAEERTQGRKNVRVLGGLEELKGLINTLVSEIPEELVAKLAQDASPLFFKPGDATTVFDKEGLQQRIEATFKVTLENPPPGATLVTTEAIVVDHPNFVRKNARTVLWSTRVHYDLKATKRVRRPTASTDQDFSSALNDLILHGAPPPPPTGLAAGSPPPAGLFGLGVLKQYPPPSRGIINVLADAWAGGDTVTVATTRATFEISWSTTLSNTNKLRAPKVEDIKVVVAPWGQTETEANT